MVICYNGPKNLHTERWVTYFARQGHEVHLVIDQPVSYEGVHVHCLDLELKKSPVYFLKKLRGLKAVLKEVHPDILHSHYITGEGYIGALTGFHPFVSTIWGTDIYVRPHSRYDEKVFTKLVMRRSDLITADSADQVEAAVTLGADPAKCRVVQWGVDRSTFRPSDQAAARAQLGLPDQPTVISQRKFQPLYNIPTIVTAFRETLSKVDARLVLTGGGFDEEEVRALVGRLGIEEHVHFTGYVPYDDLANYLNAADIAVSVPSWDGTAMAILEAMACGVPLVVSNLASNREWIEDGINGFIVEPEDAVSLSERMTKLLTDQNLRSEFSRKNVQVIRERADHEIHMAQMERYYEELCRTNHQESK